MTFFPSLIINGQAIPKAITSLYSREQGCKKVMKSLSPGLSFTKSRISFMLHLKLKTAHAILLAYVFLLHIKVIA